MSAAAMATSTTKLCATRRLTGASRTYSANASRTKQVMLITRMTMSPVLLRYMETVVSSMRRGGFSVDMTHHAMHVLGSRILGFTQELFNDTSELDTSPDMA